VNRAPRPAHLLAPLLLLEAATIVALRRPPHEPARPLVHPARTHQAPCFGEGLPTERFVALALGALRPGEGEPTVTGGALAAAVSQRGAPAAAAIADAARRSTDAALRADLLDLLRAAGYPAGGG